MRNIVFGVFCMVFISCNGHVLHQQRIDIPDGEWSYDYLLEFNTPIEDSGLPLDVILDVEHSREFSYENLYLGYHIITEEGDSLFQKISIKLADKLGRWKGTCKGNECSLQVPISTNYNFTRAGNHKIILEQYSREESLKGLKSIELTIQQAEE